MTLTDFVELGRLAVIASLFAGVVAIVGCEQRVYKCGNDGFLLVESKGRPGDWQPAQPIQRCMR